MNIRIIEHRISIVHHLFHQIISQIKCRIELPSKHTIAFNYSLLIFLTSSPRVCMGWSINLHYNSNSSQFSIIQHLLNVVWGISSSNFSTLTKLWNARYLKWKTILIDDMPMKYIHFIEH